MKILLAIFSLKSIQMGLSFLGWTASNSRQCYLNSIELEDNEIEHNVGISRTSYRASNMPIFERSKEIK